VSSLFCGKHKVENGGDSNNYSNSIIDELTNANIEIREKAVMSVLEMKGEKKVVIQDLIDMLGNDDIEPDERGYAGVALGEIYKGEQIIIDKLLVYIKDEDGMVSAGVMQGLIIIGVDGVDELVEALSTYDNNNRWKIVYIIGEIGPDARVATPALADLYLTEEETTTRCLIPVALGNIGPEERVIETLILGLNDKNKVVQENAIKALAKLGPAAKEAMPKLMSIAAGKGINSELAEYAAEEIGK